MKKNILIVILAMTTIASLALEYQQKQAADEARMLALEMEKLAQYQRMIAEEQMERAKRNEKIAIVNAFEAVKQREIAEQKK
jgi:replicative DNA helicase